MARCRGRTGGGQKDRDNGKVTGGGKEAVRGQGRGGEEKLTTTHFVQKAIMIPNTLYDSF